MGQRAWNPVDVANVRNCRLYITFNYDALCRSQNSASYLIFRLTGRIGGARQIDPDFDHGDKAVKPNE